MLSNKYQPFSFGFIRTEVEPISFHTEVGHTNIYIDKAVHGRIILISYQYFAWFYITYLKGRKGGFDPATKGL